MKNGHLAAIAKFEELLEQVEAASRKVDLLARRDGIEFGPLHTLDPAKPFVVEEDFLAAFEALRDAEMKCDECLQRLTESGVLPPWKKN